MHGCIAQTIPSFLVCIIFLDHDFLPLSLNYNHFSKQKLLSHLLWLPHKESYNGIMHVYMCTAVYYSRYSCRHTHGVHVQESTQLCLANSCLCMTTAPPLQELVSGLTEAHHNLISADQANSVLELVEMSEGAHVDGKLFAGLCCLTERALNLNYL